MRCKIKYVILYNKVSFGKVKLMYFMNLDKEKVKSAAKEFFQNYYIEIGETDLYLPDIAYGKIMVEGREEPIYASTNYAYEDRVINGNKTRYKIPLTTILLKKDKYEVIYDSYGKYYVAYVEDETIKFVRYEDFYDTLKPELKIIEE